MVKLFVGNLANTVDSHRLRNLFLQYVQVQECDVVPNKNFAFVHVTNEQDADEVINKLEKYQLDGREIHIERSTSRLRREPGMSSKCFTCGAEDHKTTMCPQEPKTGNKRSAETEHEAAKRPKAASAYQPTIINSSISSSNSPTYFSAPSSLAEKIDDPDPILTPDLIQNPELQVLYTQYLESRTRYHFFRDRLSKELKIQPEAVNTTAAPLQNAAPIHLGRVNLTSLVNRQSSASSIRTNTSGSASPFPATSTVQPSNPTYSTLPTTNTSSGANSTTLFTSNAYNVTTAPALQQCAPSTLISGTAQSQFSATRIPSLASITSRNPIGTSFTHMSGHGSSTPNGGANRR
ncbi:RNA recognition motif domain-containing protein [Ditylenchus destructor]|uniref:RNA recognition motif domain-containing protein n=1 Tax=Ditylenchus destructor TaxID=166010 RepID=A0AAD4ND49_9BILA|nr:RNA recognition motif domain-containing protein [Ditylenchus destructor]